MKKATGSSVFRRRREPVERDCSRLTEESEVLESVRLRSLSPVMPYRKNDISVF